MARFRFKFESVLTQRRALEEERQSVLARLLRYRMVVLSELRKMQETISRSKQDLAGGLVGTVNLEQVGHFARYSIQAAEQARSLVAKLSTLAKEIETAQARLLQATRARKAMELLRQRHFDDWKRQEERRETAALDELSTQSFVRRHLPGLAQTSDLEVVG